MNDTITFETNIDFILDRIDQVQPVKYARTRNFINGDVTYLSPYISRGVISTKQVMEHVLNRGFSPWKIEKFLQELAWRDYWQQIWIEKGNEIDNDLKYPQQEVDHRLMPSAILNAQTGINAIDEAITHFYRIGYIHNHVRMYIAAIACNMGKAHWKTPAQWMYYHLLDGDWASNALSWQWVAGTTRTKTYVANQENINKYCGTKQRGTFLDVPYEAFEQFHVPEDLIDIEVLDSMTPLPTAAEISIDPNKPICIYNYYNMDPNWRSDIDANRVLLLEPEVFEKYPVGEKATHFVLGLSENIPGIQTFVGSFEELRSKGNSEVFFKEHPLNRHYVGVEDSRDWMFSVKGCFSSFFGFWKRCQKELKNA